MAAELRTAVAGACPIVIPVAAVWVFLAVVFLEVMIQKGDDKSIINR